MTKEEQLKKIGFFGSKLSSDYFYAKLGDVELGYSIENNMVYIEQDSQLIRFKETNIDKIKELYRFFDQSQI